MRLMQAAIMAALVMTMPLGLSACQKKQTRPDTGAATAPGGDATTTGVEGSTGGPAGSDMQSAQQQALAALKQRSVIYFEYDSSEIRAEYVEVVAAHAAYLNKYPTTRVRLEGHTDERGSREYNIGLGERRAQTVRKAMQIQGVPDTQMTTVSYGEERPAAEGSDEAAYAQNRRVEIGYGP